MPWPLLNAGLNLLSERTGPAARCVQVSFRLLRRRNKGTLTWGRLADRLASLLQRLVAPAVDVDVGAGEELGLVAAHERDNAAEVPRFAHAHRVRIGPV